MMAFGKLYTVPGNPRSIAILAAAKENNLELEIKETCYGDTSEEYRKLNAFGKVPSFAGADGFKLTECIAIAIYIASQNEKTTLLGKTKQDYASILKWMSFFNSDYLACYMPFLKLIRFKAPYNKKVIEEAANNAKTAVNMIEEYLRDNTYFVGERITLADYFAAGIMSFIFSMVYDKEWRAANPNITRWYLTVFNQPAYSAVAGELNLIDEAIRYEPPQKETAPKKETPKAAPKPKKEADQEEDEEDAVQAPKPKHPLESLPKPTFVLDEWKRQYSNSETPEALKWFWENFKSDEYSLWKIDYKYNDELTQVFMSSNLIGGFFARLEASRKYIFGSASVYGVKDESVIQGAFIIRGQDASPAFDVAPDYESYEFTKLDHTSEEHKQFVNDQWTWEKPITVNGKEYQWADGKVFK